jgi:acyl-CoA thioester hydrolase
MTFLFELHGAGKDDLRATGLEVSVHVEEARGATSPVPDDFVSLFEAFEGKSLRG